MNECCKNPRIIPFHENKKNTIWGGYCQECCKVMSWNINLKSRDLALEAWKKFVLNEVDE